MLEPRARRGLIQIFGPRGAHLSRRSLAALALAMACASGCATMVIPPANPRDPAPVFLLEHGQHASLVLPGEIQGVVRYSYGDWRYYALGNKGITTGLAALTSSTLAGLGRRELRVPAVPAAVQNAVQVVTSELHEIHVEAAAVARLRAKLDAIFDANRDSLIYNEDIDLEFVHHPVPYSVAHNSNKLVAQWLEALGCEVRNPAFLPNWRVLRPSPSALPRPGGASD